MRRHTPLANSGSSSDMDARQAMQQPRPRATSRAPSKQQPKNWITPTELLRDYSLYTKVYA